MKTIFALWFALCLSASAALPAPAWLAATVHPAAGGGGTCATWISQLVANDYRAGSDGVLCQAVSNTVGAAQAVCKVRLLLNGIGGTTTTFVEWRSDINGGGSLIGEASRSTNVTATTDTWYDYTFTNNPSIPTGISFLTLYYVNNDVAWDQTNTQAYAFQSYVGAAADTGRSFAFDVWK